MHFLERLDNDKAHHEDSVLVPLFYSNGEPIDGVGGKQATISVTASGSTAVRAAKRANISRLLRARRKQVTPEQIDDNLTREIVAAVTEWTLPDKKDGIWPCTPENVRALFADYPLIQEQVEEGIASHAGFFETPSPT